MAKPRPATWLEKEMIYDAVKNSSEELPVDLKQCDFSRSGAGNLVCRFDGQQIFYLTKGGNLVVTSRELKAQKTRQKFEREKAKRKQKHEAKIRKQQKKREKKEQQVIQKKKQTEQSPHNVAKRERWTRIVEDAAKSARNGKVSFEIFPVFDTKYDSVRMRIVIQPKAYNDIGTIAPRQIPPQNWTEDMIREKIDRIVKCECFDIILNKDVEIKLRNAFVQYVKNNPALAIDSGLIPLMPHMEFYRQVRMIQKSTYLTKPVEIQKPALLSGGMISFYIYGVMFLCWPDGSGLMFKRESYYQKSVTFANTHKADIKACMRFADDLNNGRWNWPAESGDTADSPARKIPYAVHLSFELDTVSRALDAKLIFGDGTDAQSETFWESQISPKSIEAWVIRALECHSTAIERQEEEEKQRFYDLSFYGDLIALSALKIIRKNGNKLSKKALVDVMREKSGTRAKALKINETPECGKLWGVEQKKVSEVIGMLEDANLIRDVKNGHEHVFAITNDGITFIRLPYKQQQDSLILGYPQYTDMDWLEYMKASAKTGTGFRTKDQLPALEHRALFLLYPKEAAEFLEMAPDEWRIYIDTMTDISEGCELEYWKKVKQMLPGDSDDDDFWLAD